ncbi:hypothetical protein D187_001713 [Cystobacter fuscus DSM 2262]|uniref:Uncharacterized protein n=1 Tax=Cystobacter fuscus (strain ATCC 25194 / DSM 2262 / NBRC 100088 / M29) TaxID=1242864 RepID=S9PDD0_CYSF2|nr:hypothetical protein [Cystobacter fuscus]EPX61061.1 hypothetical protein D187_001713 [Cystobacter fuscus DSM 2262]
MAPRKSEDNERLIDWNLTAMLAVEGARRPLPPGAPARVETRRRGGGW